MAWKIVSRPDCIWCARAKAHLAIRNEAFEEEIKLSRQDQLDFKDATGFNSFPQVWHNGQHVGGFDKLKEYLP